MDKIHNDLNIEVGDWIEAQTQPMLNWKHVGIVEGIYEDNGFLIYAVRFKHKSWMLCPVLHYDVIKKVKDPNLLRRLFKYINKIIDRS